MKCLSCDCILTDFEATRKSRVTKEYIDLCSSCYSTIAEDLCDIEERDDTEEEIIDE